MTNEIIISTLKANRNTIISAINANFCTKNFDLKEAMQGYVEYVSREGKFRPITFTSEKRIFKSVEAYYLSVQANYARNAQRCADMQADYTYRGLNLIK